MRLSFHKFALILLLTVSSTISLKLNTKFFSWFFLGKDETNSTKIETPATNSTVKATVETPTKDLAVNKTIVTLPNINKETKPLEEDAKAELNIINKAEKVEKPTVAIIKKGIDGLKAKSEVAKVEKPKPKLVNLVSDIPKPEKIEKLRRMKTENIIIRPVVDRIEIIKEESEQKNGKTSKTITTETGKIENIEFHEEQYTKTEKCSEFNKYNCADICGAEKTNKCEQTTNTSPEQLFRCVCGKKTTFWYYNDGTENIICPEQDLNMASIVLQKRRVAIDAINRMNERDINQLVNKLKLETEDKVNLEDANNRKAYFKLNKLLNEQPRDKAYLEAVKQARDQKEAEKALNNIDSYVDDPSTFGHKDSLDEKSFNLHYSDMVEPKHFKL
jgi:hypothetical protein